MITRNVSNLEAKTYYGVKLDKGMGRLARLTNFYGEIPDWTDVKVGSMVYYNGSERVGIISDCEEGYGAGILFFGGVCLKDGTKIKPGMVFSYKDYISYSDYGASFTDKPRTGFKVGNSK